MSRPTLSVLLDERILAMLRESPKLTREITDLIRQEILDSWRDEQALDFEWGSDEEPRGARLVRSRPQGNADWCT